MSKFWLFVSVIGIGGLIYTGILEVNFNLAGVGGVPRLSGISDTSNAIAGERVTYEKARTLAVGFKRRAEHLIIHDREKRLVLSLLYVKNDADRLGQLIDKSTSPTSLLPQAEMLISSLDNVRSSATKAPVEVVASLKTESTEAFTQAQQVLSRLRQEHEEYAQVQQEFSRLTKALEQQVGDLGLDTSAVAGTTDVVD